MSLPDGVTIGPGRKLSVSQRGYFAPPFTACMFAGLAQILERTGYHLPLTRLQEETPPDNFVRTLQLAGDPTPGNGSTMRQSQIALQKLIPDAPVLFGTMSEAELFDALAKGATVRLIVDCSKLPLPLKRWVGTGYNGKHAVTLDGTDYVGSPAPTLTNPMVDLTDPMYRPAREIKPERVAWSSLRPAVETTADGIVVTLGYQDAAVPVDPCAGIKAENEALKAQVAELSAELATANQRIKDKDAKFQEGLLL